MNQWKELTEESRTKWEENAEFWDSYMGDLSNPFHREIIRPKTEELLNVTAAQAVLDIACGNGNFSRRLAELGAVVTAFDYSPNMVERAISRSGQAASNIDYRVIDATDYDSLLTLGTAQYDAAVANMAFMDIADIVPLVKALGQILRDNGAVVFSIPHPCFQAPGTRKIHETEDRNGEIIHRNSVQVSSYLTPEPMYSIGIKGQPVAHLIFHRPLSYYIHTFMQSGFVLDGLEEPSFELDESAAKTQFDWHELPAAVIFRFRKIRSL
ncbi:class I SAM-dependent methyltransferase [Paenibacillus sp. NPDC057934]|uniref:class I SAM-dependent methyltransferase n=1 Tax=Paenibacillus sp. NPDC057934 TaxID=3346282 RepID=UPI0036D9AC0E